MLSTDGTLSLYHTINRLPDTDHSLVKAPEPVTLPLKVIRQPGVPMTFGQPSQPAGPAAVTTAAAPAAAPAPAPAANQPSSLFGAKPAGGLFGIKPPGYSAEKQPNAPFGQQSNSLFGQKSVFGAQPSGVFGGKASLSSPGGFGALASVAPPAYEVNREWGEQ